KSMHKLLIALFVLYLGEPVLSQQKPHPGPKNDLINLERLPQGLTVKVHPLIVGRQFFFAKRVEQALRALYRASPKFAPQTWGIGVYLNALDDSEFVAVMSANVKVDYPDKQGKWWSATVPIGKQRFFNATEKPDEVARKLVADMSEPISVSRYILDYVLPH